jgi:hypothetical protein
MAATLTADVEAIVGRLGADELAQLGAIFTARAAQRRRTLTMAEAWKAWESAPLTSGWERSQLSDVGRVRIATRLLLERGLHPEQVVASMTEVALAVCPHPLVAVEVVAVGLADGRYAREGAEDV